MVLCNRCTVVWGWKPPRRDGREYDERWENDPESAHAHHSFHQWPDFVALEASATGGCALCQLLCYDLSMFPVREYRSRFKFDNWYLLAEDIEEYLRSWDGDTGVVLSRFNDKGQSGYGIYYWIGDTGVTGALPFGSTLAFEDLDRYPEKRWSLVEKWLRKCDNHPNCAISDESYVPSRLINVGSKGETSKIHLIETIANHLPGVGLGQSKYVALSYCWGQSMPPGGVTTTQNKASRMENIPIESLPLTLHDAVVITRELGIQYLWVDALCILQDDNGDWQRESGAMIQIYSNSFLTIAAASASHCNGGILQKQDRRQLLVVPMRNFSLKASTPSHRDQKESSPVSTRAWALQERELSPRILWFFQQMVGFECRELWASEAEPRGQSHPLDESGVRDRNLYATLAPSRGIGDPEGHSLLRPRDYGEIYLSWRTIVEEYSSRALTRGSDKLPALSGLAHMVQAAVGSEYAAGLWVDDFLRGLLWRRIRLHSTALSRVQSRTSDCDDTLAGVLLPLSRISSYVSKFVTTSSTRDVPALEYPPSVGGSKPSSSYIAPSWSWASVEGPIDYRIANQSRRIDPAGPEKSLNATLLRIDMQPLGSDPLGEVVSGRATLVGWVRSLRDWLVKPREFWSDELMRWELEGQETEGVMILGILRHDPFLEDVPVYNGLLIKPADTIGEYIRVGHIKAVHASWLGEVQKKEIVLV